MFTYYYCKYFSPHLLRMKIARMRYVDIFRTVQNASRYIPTMVY